MLTIHQAIFGDKAEGYGLLNATCSIELARRIANATDIHEQTPDGITWSYALRGFAWEEEYFLLMRTFVDKSPNVRQGRVYTHCLVIPAEGLRHIDNLSTLLDYLPVDIKKEASISPINFETAKQKVVEKPSSRTNCLIKSLASGNTDLIAWVDYDDYEQALSIIWANVTSAIRRNLRFGIAFSPADSKGRPGIKILTVPARLVTRWKADDISVISTNDQCVLNSDAEKILAGDTRENNLLAFIEEAAISVNKISDYSHIQTIYRTASNLAKADLNSLLTLLNTLTVYNSQNEYLKKLNEDTADQIIDRLIKGNVIEIIRLRNEDLQHLINAKRQKEVGSIIEKKLAELKNSNEIELRDLFSQLIKPNIKDWWRTATKSGLMTFFNNRFDLVSGLILQLIDTGESQIVELLDEYVSSSSNQLTFISHLKTPSSTFANYATLKIWAFKRHWFKLHAVCLTQTVPVLQALEEQLKVDPFYNDEGAFEIIVDYYDFEDLYQTGQSLDLDFITKLIAGLCIKQKKNRNTLEIDVPYSQLIMLSMIDQGWEFWSDIVQAKKRFTDMLNLITKGENVNSRLLNTIFQNPIADIYDYPNRREIWAKLSEPLRAKLIRNAAFYYMDNENLSNYSNLEFELQSALKDLKTINEFVRANKDSMAKVLPVFETLISQENYVQDYIRYYTKPLTITESVLLGQLVTRENWKSCAKDIYNKSDYNTSFKEALSECYQLLNIYDRISLSLSGSIKYHTISDAEWWQAFKEIAINLFPEGPRQKKIWEEAGGKTQDLDLSGNGREQWNYALNSLKDGSSEIKVKHLLNAMLKEYNNNPHLKLLKSWLKQD